MQFLHKISSILSRINRSAGNQSTERRVSLVSQRAALCSRSFSSPETIVLGYGAPAKQSTARSKATEEDERSEVRNSRPVAQRQPGTPCLPLFSQIPLNIFNIQNLVSGLNTKFCKESMSWDFLAGESPVINLLNSAGWTSALENYQIRIFLLDNFKSFLGTEGKLFCDILSFSVHNLTVYNFCGRTRSWKTAQNFRADFYHFVSLEEINHFLIEIVSAVVFAVISGKTGTDYYFHIISQCPFLSAPTRLIIF